MRIDIDAGVRAALLDKEGKDMRYIHPLMPYAASLGFENDADAVFACGYVLGHLYCGVVIGNTAFVGTGIRRFIDEIADGDPERAELTINGLIQEIQAVLVDDRLYLIAMCSRDDSWHSFRGSPSLKPYSRILERIRRHQN